MVDYSYSKPKQEMQGSTVTDKFKMLHKQKLPANHWMCDFDIVLLRADKSGIAAVIDHKRRGEAEYNGLDRCILFSECVAYRDVKKAGIPVYIAVWDDGDEIIDVYEWLSADIQPKVPISTLKKLGALTWGRFKDFEDWLRRGRPKRS